MRRAGPEIISSLEPGSNSDQELPSSGLFTLRTPEICRVAKGALVLHADIGRELGHELIAQTQSQFGRGEAGAYAQFGNVLRGEVQLGCGLEDQLLGQALIIFRFEPRGDVALVRKEQGHVDLEPVRSQDLHTQHRSEEHTSELQSLMRTSYAVFC